MTDERHCLQCDETKASIKAEGIVLCGIVSGYYEPELTDEWPRHRWIDWTDRELDRMGIRPESYVKHRRTLVRHLEWVGCEDTKRGHVPSMEESDWEDYGCRIGQCIACGITPEHVNGDRDAFANCDDCGSWPTHAPACPRRQDHANGGTDA